jgi:murein DD-endopeptidase MepM/ murein hydrolase activator NlpD
MKFNPLRSKKIKVPKSSKIKVAGEKFPADKNESAERVNRTVYLTVAVLLIVLAVAVAMTSAANRAKRGQAGDTTNAESTEKTPTTSAPAPETTSPAPIETAPPAETVVPSGNETEVAVGAKIPLFSLPAEGALGKEHDPTVQVFSNTLGEWRVHLGIDIMTNASAPVYAAASGKVSQISDDPLWGKCVWIEHSGDAVSIYRGLCDELAEGIEVGAKVDEGCLLGAVGEGGILELAEEPHLHFEMKVGGADVDPIEYFSKSALEALAKTVETLPIE